jgi:hypothetical protein
MPLIDHYRLKGMLDSRLSFLVKLTVALAVGFAVAYLVIRLA